MTDTDVKIPDAEFEQLMEWAEGKWFGIIDGDPAAQLKQLVLLRKEIFGEFEAVQRARDYSSPDDMKKMEQQFTAKREQLNERIAAKVEVCMQFYPAVFGEEERRVDFSDYPDFIAALEAGFSNPQKIEVK